MIYDKHKTEILMFVSESLQRVFGDVPKVVYDTITSGNIKLDILPSENNMEISIEVSDLHDRRSKQNKLFVIERDPVVAYLLNVHDTGVMDRTLFEKVNTYRVINRLDCNRILSDVIGLMLSILETGVGITYHTVLVGVEDTTPKYNEFKFRDYHVTEGNTEDKIIESIREVLLDIHNIIDEIILQDIVNDKGSSIRIKIDHKHSKINISYIYDPIDDDVTLYGKKETSVDLYFLHDNFTVSNIMGIVKSITVAGREIK